MIGYVANIKELTERSTDFHRIPYSGSTAVLSQTFSGHQFLTELIQDLPNCFTSPRYLELSRLDFNATEAFWEFATELERGPDAAGTNLSHVAFVHS
ncbi:MAG: hypothetical protein WBP18_00710 [Paracoccaceae bacterium]